jgi:phage shock protein A
MGILDRISTLVKSNLNAAIDAMSDPGREVDQLVRDMESQLKEARREVQAALGQEKQARKKAEALERSAAEWGERAERALAAGDEALAKEALVRQSELEAEVAGAKRALLEGQAYADQLTAALKALEARIGEVKLKKETLKAKARMSSGRGGGAAGGSAFNEFDRLAGKIDAVEAEAALDEELAAARHEDARSREVERKLADLDHDKDVEDRLAALKARLGRP